MPLLVRGFERVGDLPGDGQRVGRAGNGPRATPIRQRLALDELEHERGHAVDVLEAVDRGDVRVVQRRQDLRFAFEAGEPLRIPSESNGQDLDRHLAAQLASRAR